MGGIAALSLFFGSCLLPYEPQIEGDEGSVVRQVQAYSNSLRSSELRGSRLSFDFQSSDAQGRARKCADLDLKVSVEYASEASNGEYRKLDPGKVKLRCTNDSAIKLALVVDNSGSQAEVLDQIRSGASSLAQDVISRGGQVSLTRVSTHSSQLLGLSSDLAAVQEALAQSQVNRGWTALYDGIRMAQEGLGEAVVKESEQGKWECRRTPRTGVVVFTDGEDNNSEDQENQDNSDGFATRLEDLLDARHLGVKMPVFAIGMGDQVNQEVLASLAKDSGGMHLRLRNHNSIAQAFRGISKALRESVEVCTDLPDVGCGDVSMRVTYEYSVDGAPTREQDEFVTKVDCPDPSPKGKVATVLMALSTKGVDRGYAARLVANLAGWALDDPSQKILVVLDKGHRNEEKREAQLLVELLREAGAQVDYMLSPKNGLKLKQVEGYAALWFTNPGHPLSDRESVLTARAMLAQGKRVILSGDDMTRARARGFKYTDLTRLVFKNNGSKACGVSTDNASKTGYEIVMGERPHPITQGLAELPMLSYRNDIDQSEPLSESTRVLAWGRVRNGRGCELLTPVITTHNFAVDGD